VCGQPKDCPRLAPVETPGDQRHHVQARCANGGFHFVAGRDADKVLKRSSVRLEKCPSDSITQKSKHRCWPRAGQCQRPSSGRGSISPKLLGLTLAVEPIGWSIASSKILVSCPAARRFQLHQLTGAQMTPPPATTPVAKAALPKPECRACRQRPASQFAFTHNAKRKRQQ